MNKIWRPWLDTPEDHQRKQRHVRFTPYRPPSATGNMPQQPQFRHPVRLLWTKAVYDYMYASGETLLRNFPVQATIQVVDCSDSSDDDEEDEEFNECDEKENEKNVKQ